MKGAIILSSLLVTALSYQPRNAVQYMEIDQSPSVAASSGNFMFDNCNKSEAELPIYIQDLSIIPDIVELGKPIVLNVSVNIAETIDAPVKYDMDLMMFVGGKFMSLCDLLDPAICHGNDVCSLLTTLKFCPPVLQKQGLDCKCPIKQNTYSVTNLPIPLPAQKFDVSGKFKISLKLNSGKTELMCANIVLCIKNCD